MHDLEFEHEHELGITEDEAAAIKQLIEEQDTLDLVTVGIDIGSSTSHLMFARVHLQRLSAALSSRFVVVDRSLLSALEFSATECRFAYRDSFFKSQAPERYVVTEVRFALSARVPAPVRYPDLLRELEAQMTPEEAWIFDQKALGFSSEEIARLRGSSVNSVDKAMSRLKQKIHALIGAKE